MFWLQNNFNGRRSWRTLEELARCPKTLWWRTGPPGWSTRTTRRGSKTFPRVGWWESATETGCCMFFLFISLQVRKCECYLGEYRNCWRPVGRIHQYYLYGEASDCSKWKENYDDCLSWRVSQKEDALVRSWTCHTLHSQLALFVTQICFTSFDVRSALASVLRAKQGTPTVEL